METAKRRRFAAEWGIAVLALSLAGPGWTQSAPQSPEQAPAPSWHETTAPTGVLCLDRLDAGARRTLQADPCRLPMVGRHLLLDASPEPKFVGTFQREAPAELGAPDLFWRLPWRGYPPHSARSATFWR